MCKTESNRFSKTKGAGAALISQLEARKEKFNKADVVAITKTASNNIVWLEKGQLTPRAAGLAHIIDAHGNQFNAKGISNSELPIYIMTAIADGKVIGYQGKGSGRPIYEFTYKGTTHRIAITIGSNGYIVGANPKS